MNFFQLNRPPSFYEESTPIPRQHTIWNISSDFTGGQALNYRFVFFFFLIFETSLLTLGISSSVVHLSLF